MLGKCANPICAASFRKLGTGKLFAFESVTSARSTDISVVSDAKTGRTPMFFWLCEDCSLNFTLGLDAAGQLTLQSVLDGGPVTNLDGGVFDQAG